MVKENKFGRVLVVLAVLAIAYFVIQPALLSTMVTTPLEGEGDEVLFYEHDSEYNIASYTPKSDTGKLPVQVYLEGMPKQYGSIGYGSYGLAEFDNNYTHVGLKLKLNEISFDIDDGMRIALITAWTPINEEQYDRYYVEFDLYASPESDNELKEVKDVAHDGYGQVPTVEYCVDQLDEGETGNWKIAVESYFNGSFDGIDAVLDDAYVAIIKDSTASAFIVEITLMEMWLYWS